MQYDLSFSKACCHPLFHCKCPRARSHLGKHFHSTSALFRSKQRSVECSQHQEPQLESEVNQVTSELNTVSQSLALALARPAASSSLGAAPQAPKLSKIFADPRTYDSSRGKKFEEWWTHICMWQDENSATLAGAASICTMLSRMVSRDTSTFACARL